MNLEEQGFFDIEKQQRIQNRNYEESMQNKFNKGSTPSNNVQKLISSKDLKITSKKVDWIIEKIN